MGHPRDDYTPFGLVANPWAFARSWTEGEGGVLRATEQRPGLGWLLPWATRLKRGCGFEFGFEQNGRRHLTREDFAGLGLRCSYRSANLLEYRWDLDGIAWAVRFFAAGPRQFVMHWSVTSGNPEVQIVRGIWSQWGWTRDEPDGTRGRGPDQGPTLAGTYEAVPGDPHIADTWVDYGPARLVGQSGWTSRVIDALEFRIGPGQRANWTWAIDRSISGSPYQAVLRSAAREAELLAEDDAFWATCPQLGGEWPGEIRRGLVYDFETTRMCLQPAGGIFTDVWPAWMVNWPRAVLAEGTLDMLRLSFAQPEVAQRAVLSLFRDAPAPNVPCVFRHGEPNMVAADGSICGTSPAWCVPFHNLRRLYLRTLDRAWLSQLYPYLAAYVRWWLANRSDESGWTVYKCTWEAGEDNSPRLDPDQEGDHVISQFARPVELQAAMADAAATLAFFARELLSREGDGVGARHAVPGRARHAVPLPLVDDLVEWDAIEQAALERVQRLWDAGEGRFRDWDVRRGGFIEPSGRREYWGTDPRRFSPLALTPLLFGQTTPEQTAALRREIEHYSVPPWCDWPSWSYVVLETASRAGWYDFAGRLAWDIVRRVYAENDRRDLAQFERPMPGAAREYWPTDLSTWDASEGYGWGATTASFVIRQLCGFYEADEPSGFAFRLAPALPTELLDGRTLTLGPLPYRGRLPRFSYRAGGDGETEIEVALDEPLRLVVRDVQDGGVLFEGGATGTANFRLRRSRAARVEATNLSP